MKKSVIIRGPLQYKNQPYNLIDQVVKSIRDWFSGEVIISTWEDQEQYLNSNFSIDGVDKIVLSPNFKKNSSSNIINAWKSQVISYQKALEICEGDEIMVTRSDIIHNQDLFQYLNYYPKSGNELKVFSNKLIVSNIMSIRPDSDEFPNCFRICDWIQVGNRNDIFKWSNVIENVLKSDESKLNTMNKVETLWFLSVLQNKFGDVIDIYDSSNINKFAWEAIVNNFIVLNATSTMKILNKNYEFLLENCPYYLNESIYQELYEGLQ
jgi:hypothetical protein